MAARIEIRSPPMSLRQQVAIENIKNGRVAEVRWVQWLKQQLQLISRTRKERWPTEY